MQANNTKKKGEKMKKKLVTKIIEADIISSHQSVILKDTKPVPEIKVGSGPLQLHANYTICMFMFINTIH